MSRIRRIIAATDFSFSAHRAARRAGLLAKEHEATLQLLHVVNGPALRILRSRSGARPDLEHDLIEAARRALDSLAEDIVAADGVVDERVVREGIVIDELLAASTQADLLVIGPRGINPLRDFFLGSAAERMARRMIRPTLVTKQDPQARYEHVLVPVDFSGFSMSALQFARELAPDASLHVFHAVDSVIEGRLQNAGVSAQAIEDYRDELLREAAGNMTELLDRIRGRDVFPIVEAGDARALITQRAAERGCALIVMGKQGRSWLSDHVLGSVTRLVLERATCDVVVVPHAEHTSVEAD